MNPQRVLEKALVLPALVVALALPLLFVGCGGGGDSATTVTSTAITQTTAATQAGATAEPTVAESTIPSPKTLESGTVEPVSPAQIVAGKASASVVHVRVQGVTVSPFYGQEQYEGVGSGIIYTSDGYILTNDHVVSLNGEAADSVQVTLATGEVLNAKIVARDSANDVALLKIEKTGLPPVVFADADSVAVGQWAIAIGSPLDYRNSVTEGIVSGLDRNFATGDPSRPELTGLVQTDAAISPGNSGGGLFNAAGELIGMPELYLAPSSGAESMGFAIPADRVAAIAEQLMAQGQTAQ